MSKAERLHNFNILVVRLKEAIQHAILTDIFAPLLQPSSRIYSRTRAPKSWASCVTFKVLLKRSARTTAEGVRSRIQLLMKCMLSLLRYSVGRNPKTMVLNQFQGFQTSRFLERWSNSYH